MTIKIKIILGFIVLVGLIMYSSVVGYRGFSSSAVDLKEYSYYAEADSEISAFLGYVYRGINASSLYINTQNEEEMKNFSFFMSEADKSIKKALGSMNSSVNVSESSLEVVKTKKLIEQLSKYTEELQELCNLARKFVAVYEDQVRPVTGVLMSALNEFTKHASTFGNNEQLERSNAAWYRLALLMTKSARYSSSRSDEDMKGVQSNLEKMLKEIAAIGESIPEAEKESFLPIEGAGDKLKKDIEQMIAVSIEYKKKSLSTELARNNLYANAEELSNGTDKLKVDLYKEAVQKSDAGQKQLLVGSAIGVGVGIILAIFIIYSLIKVLNDISGFVRAIARGNFGYVVKTKEKGEIGEMITGMQQIPAVLQKLISDMVDGVKKIQVGHFASRLDDKEYDGSYSELVKTVNTVADTYTTILDEIPVPLMTSDRSSHVHYANKASEQSLGGLLLESYVTEGENNFGINAIESGENYISEATFLKDNQPRIMTITAVPLNDYEGNPAAFIEIVTDLTAIKDQQRIMLQVAEEATTISTRVAAASEEIAAQVEQVSRGAEVQRARVESTASAMTEMNATVIEVARSASEAAEQSDNTRVKAQEGETLVNQVMSSINQVNTVSQNLHSKMQDLGTQAENIGSVMNVISDIADQTNLLALNAAIEAARAGEAGRGFAVVADEVRKLAEKTMQATQEVGASITSVQDSARANIEEVTKAAVSIEEATQLANSSGEALNEIVSLASANSGIVASIATAAEEQSATSDEISNAISEINTIVGETSEGMVQSSSAIQELSSMAQDLQRVMAGLR